MSSSQSLPKSLPCSFYISIVFCLFNFVAGITELTAITPACQVPREAPTSTPSGYSSPTSSPSPSYTSETGFRGTVLNVTNLYRQQHNANPLTWNDTLANYAQNWANGCQFIHSVSNFSSCIIRAPRKLLCSSL
jgi:Cysteine-rich secretory protein family